MRKKVLVTLMSVLSFTTLLVFTGFAQSAGNDTLQAPGERGGGSGNCNLEKYDRTVYVHHAVEDWIPLNGSAGINVGGYFGNISFGGNSNVNMNCMLRPVCSPFSCNICDKSHLDKPFKRF